MGDWYEVKTLGDKYYIEYSSEQIKWAAKVVEITAEQLAKIEALSGEHHEAMDKFLRDMVNEDK